MDGQAERIVTVSMNLAGKDNFDTFRGFFYNTKAELREKEPEVFMTYVAKPLKGGRYSALIEVFNAADAERLKESLLVGLRDTQRVKKLVLSELVASIRHGSRESETQIGEL